jgi:hypothetical protein
MPPLVTEPFWLADYSLVECVAALALWQLRVEPVVFSRFASPSLDLLGPDGASPPPVALAASLPAASALQPMLEVRIPVVGPGYLIDEGWCVGCVRALRIRRTLSCVRDSGGLACVRCRYRRCGCVPVRIP